MKVRLLIKQEFSLAALLTVGEETLLHHDHGDVHLGMRDTQGDEFTGRMLAAINSMLVEMMAAIARRTMSNAASARLRASRRLRPPASTRAGRLTRNCTSG